MKKTLFTLLAFMMAMTMHAEQVSKQEALQKAREFMPDRQFGEARSLARSASPSDEEPFYIFNADGNQGFAIVSGDDRTLPILGYADRGQLSTDNMPANLKYWLDEYVQQLKHLPDLPVAATRGFKVPRKSVTPLIKTQWNQDAPYNTRCPLIYNQYPMTGCVATAMAQVMYYWKYPKTATPAFPQYTTSSYGINVPALPSVVFDWDHMQLTYNGNETGASATAIATLMRYCAQAVEMDFGPKGSAASLFPSDMVDFGYGKNVRQVERYLYTSYQWEELIYNEISEGRPVLYGGSSPSGGHKFICDGYDGGYFHINWGWGGMSDGYFLLSLANPDDLGIGGGTSVDGYSMDQHAIIGVEPDKGELEMPYVGGYISDKPGWVTSYTRSSASVDFSNVSLPGVIAYDYAYVEEWPDCAIDCGWGLYRDGVLQSVIGVSSLTLTYDVNWGYNTPQVSFGGGLADGTYMLNQVYRPKGSEEWQPCYSWTNKISYISAVIADNTLTLKKSAEEWYSSNVKVNHVNFSVSSFEVGRPVEVTVNLTNNGDAFQENLFFWYGSYATMVTGSVEPGQTGTVQLHFSPFVSGEIPFKITTDEYSSHVVWSETVTVEAAKPQVLSATATTPGLSGGKLDGTTLKVQLNVKNGGSYTFQNTIKLFLYKNTEAPGSMYYSGPLVNTKSAMVTIQPGNSGTVELSIPGLDPSTQYFFFCSYSSGGVDTDFDLHGVGSPFFPTADAAPKAGDVNEDGNVDQKDVEAIAQFILAGQYSKKADLNNDGKVNAADIVKLMNLAE